MADGLSENLYVVNAPAGSGKTTAIRKMVTQYLIHNPSDSILCITYTDRAAEELSKDINSANAFFGTIHSFIYKFANSFFSHKEILNLYLDIYGKQIKERIENIDGKENYNDSNERYRKKYGELSLATVKQNLKTISYNETAYNSLYYGGLSHDDLISFAKKMLDKYPVMGEKIAKKYQRVFIDEYQDTSADVLKMFYAAMKNSRGKLFLLGDKMQRIYKNYDGSFEKELGKFNDSKKLTINYRTTPCIVEILNYIYNDASFIQEAYEKNSDEQMKHRPEIILTSNMAKCVKEKLKEEPDSLCLVLLNKEKFTEIGAINLYDAVYNMPAYKYGSQYTAVDVLTKDEKNPDKLFFALFLFNVIDCDYAAKYYGKILQTFKKNSKIFNLSKCSVRKHKEKKVVEQILESFEKEYSTSSNTIKELLEKLLIEGVLQEEYVKEITTDEDYANVLNVKIIEFQSLIKYLDNPRISTQHGVKGESHDSVIFIGNDSNTMPVVHLYEFLRLWSEYRFTLNELEKLYYAHKKLITTIEEKIGCSISQMKKEIYEIHTSFIDENINHFEVEFQNDYCYKFLMGQTISKYLGKRQVTNARACLKDSTVYGILSAYKLFYVGCSRARKNLTVILDKNKIAGFHEKFIARVTACGFSVKEEEQEKN